MFLASIPHSSHLFTRSLRLNGTSRDKVADIDALEQAFMVISRTQNCFDMAMVNEAKDSGGQGSGNNQTIECGDARNSYGNGGILRHTVHC